MDMSALQPRQFGPVTRFLAGLAGADPTVLARCPERDVSNVRSVAWLLICVWLWQSCAFVLVGHMMLAKDNTFHVGVTLAGIGIATIVMLMDSYVIVRSSWHLQGLKELKRGGLVVPGTIGATIANGFFVVIRLLLSLVLAQIVAIFFSLMMYQKDIAADLEAEHQRHNGPLLARLAAQTDGDLDKARTYHDELRLQLAKAIAEEEHLRRVVVDPSLDDPEVKIALERIAALTKAKAEATIVLEQAQTFASNELAGIRGAPGNTGRTGPGPVRRAAEERVRNAKLALDAIIAELATAETKLAGLRSNGSGNAGQRKEAAAARLSDVARSRLDLTQRLAEAQAKLAILTRDREETIRKAAEADPTFKKPETGFLAHWQGLRRLTADPYVLLLVILFDLALFGIELAAVLSKLTTFVPATYATLIAQDDLYRVHKDVHDLAAKIEALQTGQTDTNAKPKPDTQKQDKTASQSGHTSKPEDATAAGAQQPRPKGQRGPRGRPPGSRFKPNFDGFGEDQTAAGPSDQAANGKAKDDEQDKGSANKEGAHT